MCRFGWCEETYQYQLVREVGELRTVGVELAEWELDVPEEVTEGREADVLIPFGSSNGVPLLFPPPSFFVPFFLWFDPRS